MLRLSGEAVWPLDAISSEMRVQWPGWASRMALYARVQQIGCAYAQKRNENYCITVCYPFFMYMSRRVGVCVCASNPDSWCVLLLFGLGHAALTHAYRISKEVYFSLTCYIYKFTWYTIHTCASIVRHSTNFMSSFLPRVFTNYTMQTGVPKKD